MHVVAGPGVEATVATLLGVPLGVRSPSVPMPLAPIDVELLRRVNSVLPYVVPADRLAAQRGALVGLMPAHGGTRPPVPSGLEEWVRTQDRRMRERLASGPWRLHGAPEESPAEPWGGEALVAAMVRLLHRAYSGAVRTGDPGGS